MLEFLGVSCQKSMQLCLNVDSLLCKYVGYKKTDFMALLTNYSKCGFIIV